MNKDEIHKICEKYYINNYTINDDLSIDVDGKVDLSHFYYKDDDPKKLTRLPLNFNIIRGSFDCDFNNLTSLKGCPKIVEGNFHCNNNKLETLEYGPEEVQGVYNCSTNKLISLKGSPDYINKEFVCDHTKIKTFDGAPKYTNYDFFCRANNIRTLDKYPKAGGRIILNGNPIQEIGELFINDNFNNSKERNRINIEYFNELGIIQKRGRATVVVLDRLNYFLQDIGEPEIDGSEIKRMKVLY